MRSNSLEPPCLCRDTRQALVHGSVRRAARDIALAKRGERTRAGSIQAVSQPARAQARRSSPRLQIF